MHSQIVVIIYEQLMALGKVTVWSWGAHDWKEINSRTLQFKVEGAIFKGHVRIEYDEGWDLYNIYFGRFAQGKWKLCKSEKGVYADQLVDIIDEQLKKPRA